MKTSRPSLPVAGFAFLCFARAAVAAVVTDCSESALRSALSEGGLVTIACDGTIVLAEAVAIADDVTIDGGGHQVVVAGSGTNGLFTVNAGKQLTLLSLTLSNGLSTTGGAIRNDAGTVIASNCVFRGNLATGTNTAAGGAIYNSGGSLSILRSTFSDNRALMTGVGTAGTNGSAFDTAGGPGGPGSAAAGGAIWSSGELIIQGSYFIGNNCVGGLGGVGGPGGAFSGQAGGSGGIGGKGEGGTIFQLAGTAWLNGSTFCSNSVRGGQGGTGGSVFSGPGGAGGLGGTASGAGIHAESGSVFATNNTWFGNHAIGGVGGTGGSSANSCWTGGSGGPGGTAAGGAVFAGNAGVLVSHNTLAQNVAGGGAGGGGGLGGFCPSARVPGPYGAQGAGRGSGVAAPSNSMTLVATIFASNLSGGNGFGSFLDGGFNISSDSSINFTNEGGWINVDPKLLPLADNGGPTPTMALQADSPAIDHSQLEFGPAADQRGISRPSGSASDAGAYELVQSPGPAACETALLRASVAAGGLVIPHCEGVYRITSPFLITNDTTIDASGRNVVLTGGRGSRLFYVKPGVTLKLIHITIRDGFSTGGGAAVYNDGGIVTLIDCVLATNRAAGSAGVNGTNGLSGTTPGRGGDGTSGSDAKGGAIFNTGLLRITNCSFYGNSVVGGDGGKGGQGGYAPGITEGFRCRSTGPGGGGTGASGGDGWGGAIYNLGDAVMLNVGFAGNTTDGGDGGAGGPVGGAACFIASQPGPGGNGGAGGAALGAAIYSQGTLTLSGCAISDGGASGGDGGVGGAGLLSPSGMRGVSGTGGGGAIFNQGTNALINVTVANNNVRGGSCADAVGGAIYNAGYVLATNCTIWANRSLGGAATNGCSVPGRSLAASVNTGNGALTLLLNSIVGNSDSTSNCVGTINDAGHNICSDASAAFSAPGSLNSTDPKLGPLADNGGPTRTMSLQPGSPALDAGDGSQCPLVDQRGVSRPVGSACDIGAFEGTDGFHYPKLVQTFTPAAILAGTPSTLRLTLTNTSVRALSNISFTNRLPALVFVVPTPNLHSDCGGAVALNAGTIAVSGVNLPPQEGCSISVDVSSLISGTYTNIVDPVSSSESGPASASEPAILVVDAPPVALTGVASNKTGTGAMLNALVNPNGFTTTAYFELGSTTNYGTRTPMQTIGNGRALVPVVAPIAGLTPATGYHFRIVAESVLGTSFGQDQFLLTLGPGPGTGVSLDGVDDYVTTPEMSNSFTNETVTIEVWFRAITGGTIVRERGTPPPINGPWNDPQIELLGSGEVKVSVAGIQSAVSLGTAIFGAWHHVALRYDKATTNLDGFLDGAEAAADAKGDRDAPWEYGSSLYYAFGLGDWPVQPWVEFFRGELGEVRIWNVARTADEIRTNLYRRLSGSEPGLACYWRFDEGMGTNAADGSAHGNTGSLAYGVAWVHATRVAEVITDSISEISPTSATLNALVNPNGTVPLVYFEYGLSTNYTRRTVPHAIDAFKPVSVSQQVNGLFPGVEYHYRAVASNDFGIAYGKEAVFFTLGLSAPGNAIQLDGVDDFIVTPDLRNAFPNESVTIELWFKPFTPGVVIDERGQPPPEPGWQDSQMEILASGEVRIRVWNLAQLSLGTVGFGNWHHAVLRYEKASANFDGFLDGVEAAVDVSGDRTAPWESGYGMYYAFGLGDSAHLGSGKYLTGEIDEVRIWNVARSGAEILANRFRRLTGLEPGLICYWRLDEGIGPALDATGRGNHGSVLNGAQRLPSTAPIMDAMRLTRLPDGRLQLDYLAAPGSIAVLQASTNLTEWTSVRTNSVAIDGLTTFEDIAAPQFSHEFFRIVSP